MAVDGVKHGKARELLLGAVGGSRDVAVDGWMEVCGVTQEEGVSVPL